jgi:hypothetical protein
VRASPGNCVRPANVARSLTAISLSCCRGWRARRARRAIPMPRHGQGDPSRRHQRDNRVRRVKPSDQTACKEPDAHAGSQRQSAGSQSSRGDHSSPKSRGTPLRGIAPRRQLTTRGSAGLGGWGWLLAMKSIGDCEIPLLRFGGNKVGSGRQQWLDVRYQDIRKAVWNHELSCADNYARVSRNSIEPAVPALRSMNPWGFKRGVARSTTSDDVDGTVPTA